MALSIKNPEADRLARALADTTGESITEAVTTAIRQRLARETGQTSEGVQAAIDRIVAEVAGLPVLDDRTADEIVGYDERGLPT